MAINVYMSSTNFGFFNFRDKNWKTKFRYYLPCNINCIDPLEVISDDPEIVDTDIKSIHDSDYIVCYLGKKVTIGTIMEVMYSIMLSKFNEYDLPVILIDKYKIHRKHPWIKKFISFVVDNEKEAALKIQELITMQS